MAGDVQGTPVGRQLVRRSAQGFINGPLLPIGAGAPPGPAKNPQGGFVPESIVCLPGDVLVGARRGKPFSCSGDLGQTWTVIEGAGNGLYQPCIRLLPDGRAAAFGHCGADSAVGQTRMAIAADLFRLDGAPPAGCELSLERVLSADGSHYGNAYTARLTCKGSPVAGRRVTFRVVPFWTEDGAVNTLAQEQAPIRFSAMTDADGLTHAAFPAFDAVRDIHFAYTIDAFAEAAPGQASCVSASRCELAMTPYRRCRHPYPAYFAENTLPPQACGGSGTGCSRSSGRAASAGTFGCGRIAADGGRPPVDRARTRRAGARGGAPTAGWRLVYLKFRVCAERKL